MSINDVLASHEKIQGSLPVIDHNEANPKYLVTPEISGTPAKRTLGDAGASQAIYEVRIVIDPPSKNDGMQSLRNVDADCLVLGRNKVRRASLDGNASTAYAVFIGTAIAGSVVTEAATEAQFLTAMVQLDFAAINATRGLRLETLDRLAAAGSLDARYMTLIVEGYSHD